MAENIHQGDVLKVEKIKPPVLVVSKDLFNSSGEIIGCPIYEFGTAAALHIEIKADRVTGYVYCEQLSQIDLNARSFSRLSTIPLSDIINITDAVQSIFDYI